MKLVHLSDTHLGFRQYQRQTPTGINQREADVAATFKRAIDKVIEIAPQLVVIGGDIFHTVRPTNPAILHAFTQFSRLRHALPSTEIVMVAGNHDLPRTVETGCILRLFTPLGIHVVDAGAKRIHLEQLDVGILAVPDLAEIPVLTPQADVRYNVLLMHGEVADAIPHASRVLDRATVEITKEILSANRWDYVALGHYHVYKQVGENAYYSGSLDYTSSNPWEEMREERNEGIHDAAGGGKGIIEHDLATGVHKFHQLPVSRVLIDLRPIDAVGMTAADVDAAIEERVTSCPGGIEDKVVRLVIRDIPRHIVRELNQKVIRDMKRRALHFQLDPRKPERIRRDASGAPFRRPSLADTVRDKLTTRVIPTDMNRDAFVELGLRYLEEADARAQAAPLANGAIANAALTDTVFDA